MKNGRAQKYRAHTHIHIPKTVREKVGIATRQRGGATKRRRSGAEEMRGMQRDEKVGIVAVRAV